MTRISVAEYEERLSLIQREMAHLGLDALLVYSWKRGQVRYVSGYKPNYVANVAMVVVPSLGEPTLLIRFPFDMERARKMSWLADIRASGDFPGLARDCQTVLRERSGEIDRIGLVSGDFVVDEMPHSLYEMLKAALPESEFVPALSIFENARLRKSPAEAELTRDSARVADAALAAAALLAIFLWQHNGMKPPAELAEVDNSAILDSVQSNVGSLAVLREPETNTLVLWITDDTALSSDFGDLP